MQQLDHVALVTPLLEPVLERLAPCGLETGPIESFPSEGSREVYLGADPRSARLLLVQPLGDDGPYARALRKRGPGLHHVARPVADLAAHLRALSGWLLLPHSLESVPGCGTAWLARPGTGLLLEVTQGAVPDGAPVVSALEVPSQDPTLIAPLGLAVSDDGGTYLTIAGTRWSASELAG